MCDTMVALGNSAEDGSILFAKKAFEESLLKTEKWISKDRSLKNNYKNRWYFSSEWATINKIAGISNFLV